jgi:hypothetical protein
MLQDSVKCDSILEWPKITQICKYNVSSNLQPQFENIFVAFCCSPEGKGFGNERAQQKTKRHDVLMRCYIYAFAY